MGPQFEHNFFLKNGEFFFEFSQKKIGAQILTIAPVIFVAVGPGCCIGHISTTFGLSPHKLCVASSGIHE